MAATADTLREIAEQVVLDRRHLHMHPELGREEHGTAAFVAERLRSHGIEVRTGIADTGVLGELRGGRPGRTVLLRADMDALPILEENDVPYRSTAPGQMHACGHDAHTAILLGAARVLVERRDQIPGTIKFAFQPSEERPPRGAEQMIAEGVMDDPPVDAVFGLHAASYLPVGTVAATPGPALAASDRFRIEVRGVGGHAAMPQKCVDSVLVASQIVVALHQLVAREVDPFDTAVVTVGSIQAGETANVIPPIAVLLGTFRSYDEAVRQHLAHRIGEVAEGIARTMRAEAVCEHDWGVPACLNDPAMAALVADVAREVVGAECVRQDVRLTAGDDMAYFLRRAPGCYFLLGTRNEALGLTWDHHHPKFEIDESALPLGVDLLVRVTERFLAG